MTRPTFSVGSLFSGVGALDLGLIRTGAFHVAFHVENEPFCQRILAERYPDVPTYGDITQCYGAGKAASADNLSRTHALPPVDVLVGGFPCTDLSSSGKQAGIDDGKASGLWREFARLIGEIRPWFCIIENVAALRSPTRKKGQAVRAAGLGRVLGDLAALGYDAEWHCLPAARLGAPHQRDRIFILAYRQPEYMANASSTGTRMEVSYASRQRGQSANAPQPTLVRLRNRQTDAEGVGTGSTGSTQLANADSLRRHDGGNTGGERPVHSNQERDAQETHADGQQLFRDSGQIGAFDGGRDSTELAYATAVGLERPELLGQPDGVGARPRDTGSNGIQSGTNNTCADRTGNGVNVANANSAGLAQWQEFGTDAARTGTTPQRGGVYDGGRAEDTATQYSSLEPCLGRDLAGITARVDAVRQRYRWPARPGEAQYPWEPPRVTQEVVPDRVARIKALGNAVVVAVGQAVGELLLYRIEEMQRDQQDIED